MKLPSIPAHIFWPGLIIALLLSSVGWSATILMAAQSDGGPQVIPDYYQRSVDFEQEIQARRTWQNLGWTVDVEHSESMSELVVVDADGEPVADLEGSLVFRRPSLALPIGASNLIESQDEPGRYRFDDLADAIGLWDLELELQRGGEHFTHIHRITVDP